MPKMLSLYHPVPTFLRTTIPIFLLLSFAAATNSSLLCDPDLLGYSPFTPWFQAWRNVTSGPGNNTNVQNMACWWYADCCFSVTPDTRKQQHAAASLVMGLVPLILKDIAWPERRIAYIPLPQEWHVEILVRALGLNPVVDKEKSAKGRTFEHPLPSIVAVLLVIFLITMYAALVVIELFSKRSSLGCPVPAFVALWFIVALLPSALEVAVARIQGRDKTEISTSKPEADPAQVENGKGQVRDNIANINLSVTVSESIPSESIPGGEEGWFVQLSWAAYYTAGTLIFSSIMLVTVIELFVWVLAAFATTLASRMLGYKLCGYWGLEKKARV